MKNSTIQSRSNSRGKYDAREDFSVEDSPFHCSVEWHLSRMKSQFASILYPWARRIAHKSQVFSASAERTARHFNVDRKTVLRALEELWLAGFFELERVERFKPNVYRIVDHREWGKRNPGRCVKKASFPWDGEGDLLGQQLFAISGQRVRFLPNQVKGLRVLRFSDEEIADGWRTFLQDSDYEGKDWERAYYDFHAYLKQVSVALSRVPPAHAVGA